LMLADALVVGIVFVSEGESWTGEKLAGGL